MPSPKRKERRLPCATPDLMIMVSVRTMHGYCPRDGGLLVPTTQDEMADARCVTCGYRHYTLEGARQITKCLARAKREDEIYYAAIDRFRKQGKNSVKYLHDEQS